MDSRVAWHSNELAHFAYTANAGSDAVREFEAAGFEGFLLSRWIFRC